MKLITIITFLWQIINFCFAQTDKANNYINQYKVAAINEMKRSGVPASITLAQGMLESGYGESELTKKSNNHFGIKCKNDWQGDKVYHNDDEKGECFRAYKSVEDSYKDHSDFLKSRPWYSFLFNLDPTDYEGWAYGLKKAGYATEKDYAPKLIKIITDYNLQQYTLMGLGKSENDSTTTINSAEKKVQKDTIVPTPIQNHEQDSTTISDDEPTTNETRTEPIQTNTTDTLKPKKTKYNTDSVFTINHTKVIYTLEGTSLLALANKYQISLSSLYSFNDMEPIDLIDMDRLIFIERKQKKGAEDTYTSIGNETLYDISQTKGVQLSSILQFNKGIKKDFKLSSGTKIYLRQANKPKTQQKNLGG
jgi:hypothetical protein